ncbi:glycosyltransferase [Tepidibacter sp. Z1-5]|uniref:glycosyltransferase n=1 Tax=Tepidibacter sp. Z1-5 TaxID=3134138 RepID=UPI0030BD4D48
MNSIEELDSILKKVYKLNENNEIEQAEKLVIQTEQILTKTLLEILSIKSVINIQKQETERAKNILEFALKIDENNFDCLYNLAYIYESDNEFEKSIQCYNRAKMNCLDSYLINNIDNIIYNLQYKCNCKEKKGLLILDDTFPNLLSSFRLHEYNYYLKSIENTIIGCWNLKFENLYKEYKEKYPYLSNHIFSIEKLKNIESISLLYTMFLNNIYYCLPIINNMKIPFVFTLYPGGGFWIDSKESDEKLKQVCMSPFLRKVIVTQKNTYDYLINKNFLEKEKIEFIYGGILPTEEYKNNYIEKKYYKKDKYTFDICFVANKYMKNGRDKGYDIFIDVCKALNKIDEDIRFHVVGGFSENDIDIYEINDNIKFYGMQHTEFFYKFYSSMDIILSPNEPFVLYPGSFDGFPTGCCVEAGLAGVSIFCTDKLNLNICFEDKKDICIINRDVKDIVEKIIYYKDNVEELYTISQKGRDKLFEVFDLKKQMEERMNILKKLI